MTPVIEFYFHDHFVVSTLPWLTELQPLRRKDGKTLAALIVAVTFWGRCWVRDRYATVRGKSTIFTLSFWATLSTQTNMRDGRRLTALGWENRVSLRLPTPPMETPDPPSDTPGASKQVVLTPHDIPRSLRDGDLQSIVASLRMTPSFLKSSLLPAEILHHLRCIKTYQLMLRYNLGLPPTQ